MVYNPHINKARILALKKAARKENSKARHVKAKETITITIKSTKPTYKLPVCSSCGTSFPPFDPYTRDKCSSCCRKDD